MSDPRACPFHTPGLGSPEHPAELGLSDAGFFDRAHTLYAELRERGAVARARFDAPERTEGERRTPFDDPFWLVVSYDAAVELLQDDERCSVDPGLEPGDPDDDLFTRSLLSLDPPDHTRLRKLVQPWFAGPALERLRPRIRHIADELLDQAEAAAAARGERAPDRQLDLVDGFAWPLPVTVISEMLGLPQSDRERVRQWTDELLSERARAPGRGGAEQRRRFVDYLREQVARKRRAPADDLISFLVEAEDQGDRLDEDELLAMVFLLYVAGHVTTVNLLANAVAALLRWPDQLAAVRADPSLVRNTIEETLRFWGPAETTLLRVAKAPIELEGVRIEAGERVAASLAAADRDPARFPDPDRFDVRRQEARRHVAFGRGLHTCLGAPLARLEGTVALGALLERCPDLRPAAPMDALAWKAMFLRGFEEVPVRF